MVATCRGTAHPLPVQKAGATLLLLLFGAGKRTLNAPSLQAQAAPSISILSTLGVTIFARGLEHPSQARAQVAPRTFYFITMPATC